MVRLMQLIWIFLAVTIIADPVPIPQEQDSLNIDLDPISFGDPAENLPVAVDDLSDNSQEECPPDGATTEVLPNEIYSDDDAPVSIVRRLTGACRTTGSMGAPRPEGTNRSPNPGSSRQTPSRNLDYPCKSSREKLVSCTGPEIDSTGISVPEVVNCIFGEFPASPVPELQS